MTAAILDLNFFHGVLYSTSQALSFDTHIEEVEKKCNPPFSGGGHLGFGLFSWCALYSTSQALSFDTHIEGVEKIYVIRHVVAAAILDLQ